MSHCFELLYLILKKVADLRPVSSHYTADGITAEVIDTFDGKSYVISIKEVV